MKSLNILFITLDGGGNLPPVFGLANLLADRGHKVRVLSEPIERKIYLMTGMQRASNHRPWIMSSLVRLKKLPMKPSEPLKRNQRMY